MDSIRLVKQVIGTSLSEPHTMRESVIDHATQTKTIKMKAPH